MNPGLTGAEILIAEDERVIRRSLVAMLEAEGCVVRAAGDGRKAFEMYQERRPDLVILDVMMPKADGFSVCESIRRNDSVTPVVFLTALDSERDELRGLEGGGDVYISKSVSTEVFLARVAAALRRNRRDRSNTDFDIGGWRVDCAGLRMSLRSGGAEVRLSEREVAMLRLFAGHPDEVFSRDFLLSRFWGMDYEGNENSLSVAVKRCREKLGADGARLESVRGSGYVLRSLPI